MTRIMSIGNNELVDVGGLKVQSYDDDLVNYIDKWLYHWVNYVEETVFDVNMLVIDKNNVICSNYNEKVFKKFDEYGITPHVVNFRHQILLGWWYSLCYK